MLRWFFLGLALAFAAFGLLNVGKAPDWLPWRLGVLTGEFGHWLAGLPVLLAVAAWLARGPGGMPTHATLALCVVAAGLLLKPAFQAWNIAAALPERMAAQFPRAPELPRAPFAWGGLVGSNPAPVAVQTLKVSGDLPLDFYPAAPREGRPAPCVIIVHGGGWDSGDRTQLPGFNHWLAQSGYAVAAISYRLAPAFRWPAQRDDTAAAIAYLKAHATELRIDPARFVICGRSAGGQIAETVGYAAEDPAIRGVIGLYAPSDMVFAYVNAREDDMLKSPTLMRQYLGGTPDSARASYESASAMRFVKKSSPPTLLIHGENDALVWHRHSVRLDALLTEQGVPHVFVSLPWATHAFEFNLHGPGGQLTTYAVERFLAAVTK